MKNKETPFCEPAQRTKSYVTGKQKGFDTVIRKCAHFVKVGYWDEEQGNNAWMATLIYLL